MNLKEFIENVLVDIDGAVESARNKTLRDIHLSDTSEQRTVEFDIAVSAEEVDSNNKKAGIRVLQFVEGAGTFGKEIKNSTISRIKFGIHVDVKTKEEKDRINKAQNKKSPSYL